MALSDFIIGRPPVYVHEDDPLAKPFPGESEDLKIHADVCAMRYGRIMEGQSKSDLANYDLRAFIIKAFIAGFVGLGFVMKGGELLQFFKVM